VGNLFCLRAINVITVRDDRVQGECPGVANNRSQLTSEVAINTKTKYSGELIRRLSAWRRRQKNTGACADLSPRRATYGRVKRPQVNLSDDPAVSIS